MTVEHRRGAGPAAQGRLPPERVALVDLLDRLLAGGVVVTGELVLSIADIELVRISLRALLASVREGDDTGAGAMDDYHRAAGAVRDGTEGDDEPSWR